MDAFQKALDLIPEASYDLIGRLLPGGIAVASVASFYSIDVYGFTIDSASGFLEVAIFLAVSYAAGLAISTLAHPLYWLAWMLFVYWLLPDVVTKTLSESLAKESGSQSLELKWNGPLDASFVLDRAHDLIKRKDPAQSLVVTKLSAEVSLVYGLSIATGLYALLSCGQLWVIPVALLLVGLLRSIRLWQRHASILQAVAS
jgi:hypothetical protein